MMVRTLFLSAFAGAACAVMAVAQAAAPAVRGAPEIQVAKQMGLFVWSDAKGVHVRFNSAGKPVLFSGSLESDRPMTQLSRTNPTAGGWVEANGERVVLFSSTVVESLDGFDVAVPAGASLKIDFQIDGQPAAPTAVFMGEKLAQPQKLPVRFSP